VPDLSLRVVDAALRSSAAPTIFPIYQGYCDGAITANNPSLVAVSKALAHTSKLRREDVRVLSLGAGSRINSLAVSQDGGDDWGLVQWAPHFVSMLLDSNAISTDLLAGLMLGHARQYHRVECVLQEDDRHNFALDDVRGIDRLIDLANETDLEPTIRFINVPPDSSSRALIPPPCRF